MSSNSPQTGFVPGTPERPAFYERSRFLAKLVQGIFFKLDVQGLENIPADGPVMIVSNHLSFWDIPSLAIRPRRMLHFIAKSEYARNGFMRWLFTNLESFFVDRGESDMGAIRNALAVLKAGQMLAIYPEGHRSDDHAMIPAHDGFALIAFKANVPIIPAATWGSEVVGKGGRFLFAAPTVHVRYGAPIHLMPVGKRATREELTAATEQVMGAIAAQLPTQYRGVYAEAAQHNGTGAAARPTSATSESQAAL
ncbi:MAG: 1-acyl-sn-glycerol-3-phosphate acyltransferase [Ktedonobacterales bacterium]|nr:1-acyl-sn-glycerol-3-phosphate acyltransferase [Ktedonobacterales bacterium]